MTREIEARLLGDSLWLVKIKIFYVAKADDHI